MSSIQKSAPLLFECTAEDGSRMRLTNLGASLTALYAPDRQGRFADVVWGFDSPEEYITNPCCLGVTCGRFAGRIAHGKFTLDGTDHAVTLNFSDHHLHGGDKGFSHHLFDAAPMEEEGHPGIRFRLVSPDGDEGYPGTLKLTVTYILKPGPEVVIRYQAVTDKATVLNLTNHSYFNLAGHDAGSIDDHTVQIHANEIADVKDMIPTGSFSSVSGTPFDFTRPFRYGEKAADLQGYDISYRLPPNRDPSAPVTCVEDPISGRMLTAFTTQPCLHFYTAGSIPPVTGKNHTAYQPEGAFCLETQHFPDSPNRPEFPSTVLRPGEVYHHETRYCFSVTG